MTPQDWQDLLIIIVKIDLAILAIFVGVGSAGIAICKCSDVADREEA